MKDPGIRFNTADNSIHHLFTPDWQGGTKTTRCPTTAGMELRLYRGWYDASGTRIGSFGLLEYWDAWTLNSWCGAAWLDTSMYTAYNQTAPAGSVEYRVFYVYDNVGDGVYNVTGDANEVTVAEARSVAPPSPPPAPLLAFDSTAPGGKTLSYDQAAALCLKYGWTSEQAATECTAVMRQESAFRTKAVSYIGCCYGLLQVYASLHNTTKEAMFDPDLNVQKAREIYVAAGSWQPWEAWTGPDGAGSDGPWLQWEGLSREAVKRQRSCGGCAYGSIASQPATDSGSVSLSWFQEGTCGGCEFAFQRKITGGAFETIHSYTGSARLFTDNNAAVSTTYVYRMKSTNGVGPSPWSNEVTVTTGAADSGGTSGSELPEGNTGAGDEDGANAGTGQNCWSLNPITVLKCALRWAFVPSSFGSKWAGFKETMTSKPPFSLAVGTASVVWNFFDNVKVIFESESVNGVNVCLPTNGLPEDFTSVDGFCVSETFGVMAESVYVPIFRTVIMWMALFGITMASWRILRSTFGGADAESPNSQVTDAQAGSDDSDR